MEQASVAAIVDAHGVVTGWSEGARRLTGYPAEETVGR
ncbi:PAS domain-containing protein, partial [Streptomyces sp. SID8499]|nr:PAS domain-containing protein [Streptomyces sp. SID8499]